MTDTGSGWTDVPSSVLLPGRRAAEAERLKAPLQVVAGVALTRGDDQAGPRYLVVRDADGVRIGVPAVGPADLPRRALAGDGASAALIARLDDPPHGMVVQRFGPPVTLDDHHERFIDVDQTNELVVVGGRLVVKWMLHPGADGDVAAKRLETLAEAGFEGVPGLHALVRLPAGELVATITQFVDGAVDGWTWAVDDLRGHAVTGSPAPIDPIRSLGRLTARMHVALATDGVSRADADQVAGWARGAARDLESARLADDVAAAVAQRLQPIGLATATTVIPVHGDFHIGQVLRTSDGRLLVIDFDGSPLLPAAERSEPQPAARDVAGMLASLDHVGRVVVHRTEGLDAAGRQRVLDWIEAAQAAYLGDYRQSLDASGAGDLLDDELVDAFQVQQECREYAYAERYLPHWRYVPDAALPALLARGRT